MKAVENFQRRAAISSSGKEVKPKDSKVSLALVSDSCACMYVRGVYCGRSSRLGVTLGSFPLAPEQK